MRFENVRFSNLRAFFSARRSIGGTPRRKEEFFTNKHGLIPAIESMCMLGLGVGCRL